jgi:hypothetical protein
MNGIHEVTGSIPVWSTNLRSPCDLAGTTVGKRTFRRRLSTVARSAKVDLLPSTA